MQSFHPAIRNRQAAKRLVVQRPLGVLRSDTPVAHTKPQQARVDDEQQGSVLGPGGLTHTALSQRERGQAAALERDEREAILGGLLIGLKVGAGDGPVAVPRAVDPIDPYVGRRLFQVGTVELLKRQLLESWISGFLGDPIRLDEQLLGQGELRADDAIE